MGRLAAARIAPERIFVTETARRGVFCHLTVLNGLKAEPSERGSARRCMPPANFAFVAQAVENSAVQESEICF